MLKRLLTFPHSLFGINLIFHSIFIFSIIQMRQMDECQKYVYLKTNKQQSQMSVSLCLLMLFLPILSNNKEKKKQLKKGNILKISFYSQLISIFYFSSE
jgi:hypothetical protein